MARNRAAAPSSSPISSSVRAASVRASKSAGIERAEADDDLGGAGLVAAAAALRGDGVK